MIKKVGYELADATAAVEMAIEPTVYVWRQSRYEEDEGYYDVAGKNIDVKDITVTSGEMFHIFKDKGVILRSSVLVEEGGELIIFERLEE